MAKRHFYSRVPARASMYNLSDSFDTFAMSAGITKEFTEVGLGRLLEFAPAKTDRDFILDGMMPPVYCMLRTGEGETVQSCITFINSDFTGERASYMINSLVFGTDEQREVFSRHEGKYLTEKMFGERITDFDITSPKFNPITDYPEAECTTDEGPDISDFIAETDDRVVKKLIYALMTVTTSKNKVLYIAPVMPQEELSAWGLDFVNCYMQIFPAVLRPRFNFITYIAEYKKMNCFNIKFVHGDNVTASNGFVFDMTPNKLGNIKDSDYKAYEQDVDFLYELIADKARRKEFDTFCTEITDLGGDYANPGLNILHDLILLFRQCRYVGETEENDLIANDAASYTMITTYEKHRDRLRTEDRCAVLQPLIARYSRVRSPIPANIFTKLTKLYPKEPHESRIIIMDGILALIHTDAMRDKLFAFARANFDDETPERREIICENLTKVFYGGFLQDQLLDFFDKHFTAETEKSRSAIIEKLLLSIRTEAVRDRVFEVLCNHASEVTEEQRTAIYTAMYEAIPVGDITAARAVGLLNTYAESDTVVSRSEVVYELFSLLENCEASGSHAVTNVIVLPGTESGIITSGIIRRIVQKNAGTRLFGYTVTRLCGDSITGIGGAMQTVWQYDEAEPETVNKALYDKINAFLRENADKASLEDTMELRDTLRGFTNLTPIQTVVRDKFLTSKLIPLMAEKFATAVDPRICRRNIGYYAEYASGEPLLADNEGVKLVEALTSAADCLNGGNAKGAVAAALSVRPATPQHRQIISARLRTECKQLFAAESSDDIDYAVRVCTDGTYPAALLSAAYIEGRDIVISELYENLLKVLEKQLMERLRKSDDIKNMKAATAEAHDKAVTGALGAVIAVCLAVCASGADESLAQKLCHGHLSELDYSLAEIFPKYFKGLKKYVMTLSAEIKPIDSIVSDKLKNCYSSKPIPRPAANAEAGDGKQPEAAAQPAAKPKSKGFFSIFGKK